MISTRSPIVSIPKDNGITSNNKSESEEFPDNISACIEAPIATTLSGFILLKGFLLNFFSIADFIKGVFVEPPTKIISSIFSMDNFASSKTFLQIDNVFYQ